MSYGGYFAGGLLDGFTQGLNTVLQYQQARRQAEREDRLDQANADWRAKQYGLAQAELDVKKQGQADTRAETQARLGILQESLGLDRAKTQSQIDISNRQLDLQRQQAEATRSYQQGQLGLAQAQNARAEQDQQFQNAQNAIKLQQLKRAEGLQFAQTQLYPKLAAGTMTPDDAAKWKQATGLDLADLADNRFVDSAVGIFRGVKNGTVKLDDPQVNAVADRLYHGFLQRGIGEPAKVRDAQGNPTGPDIIVTGKSWAGAYPTKDGRFGVNVWVTGRDDKGTEHRYLAPVTMTGAGGDDPIMAFSGEDFERPLAAAMYFNQHFNSDPQLRANVDAVLRGGADPGAAAKQAAEVEQMRAKADFYRSKATGAGDAGKEHASKMDDVRAMNNQRFGGRMNQISGEIIGADTAAWDAVNAESDRLLRENPALTAAQAFTQASQAYQANKGKSQQPGSGQGFKEGQIYQDASGKKARWQNGSWIPVQ